MSDPATVVAYCPTCDGYMGVAGISAVHDQTADHPEYEPLAARIFDLGCGHQRTIDADEWNDHQPTYTTRPTNE